MLSEFLMGFGLYLGYFALFGLPSLLLKTLFNVPFELVRKMLHIILVMSIFPLVYFFGTWVQAALAALIFALLLYPVLALAERTSLYRRLAVERKFGEFKSSLIIAQLVLASLIAVFWGLLGDEWHYVSIVAVMAWGYGDAAAALVGKAIGRHPIRHPQIEGAKTYEGTLAMYIVAGLAIFFALLVYAGHSWQASLIVATLTAPVSATVELFTRQGLDTLTVPISVAFLVMPLILACAFMGV